MELFLIVLTMVASIFIFYVATKTKDKTLYFISLIIMIMSIILYLILR